MKRELLEDIGVVRVGVVRIYKILTDKFVTRRTLWAFEDCFFVRDRHGAFYKLNTSKYRFEMV